jgi:hypothetical protein
MAKESRRISSVLCALLGIESKTGSWSCGMQVNIERTREIERARDRDRVRGRKHVCVCEQEVRIDMCEVHTYAD